MSSRQENFQINGVPNSGSLRLRARAAAARMFSSIGMRLVAVVVATGVLAFAAIGGLTILRLDLGLKEQANALGKLSGKQIVLRLEGEAQLARARIELWAGKRAAFPRLPTVHIGRRSIRNHVPYGSAGHLPKLRVPPLNPF